MRSMARAAPHAPHAAPIVHAAHAAAGGGGGNGGDGGGCSGGGGGGGGCSCCVVVLSCGCCRSSAFSSSFCRFSLVSTTVETCRCVHRCTFQLFIRGRLFQCLVAFVTYLSMRYPAYKCRTPSV